VVKVGRVRIGQDPFPVLAGPHTVESESHIRQAAAMTLELGGAVLRSRTFLAPHIPAGSPRPGKGALAMLEAAGRESGLPTATQVHDVEQAHEAADVVDLIEVASQRMQDFELLKTLGRLHRPVMLRRGQSATLDELLWAAEYLLSEGNSDVILVERGIRTFAGSEGATLDLGALPRLRDMTHLPVIVDPSQSSGSTVRLQPLALAAQGVGADGLIVQVADRPVGNGGPLELDRSAFAGLMAALGIERLRDRIDLIDRHIVRLLSRRQELALEIGMTKQRQGLPVQIPERERQLLTDIEGEAAAWGVDVGHARALFTLVLAESRRLQHEMRDP
jgi:3-deoxy-7-phosphoheptulonate synthase